jgi:hypothetical protein
MARSARLRITAAAGMAALACAGLAAGTSASAAAAPAARPAAAAPSARVIPACSNPGTTTALTNSPTIGYGDEQDEVFTATVTGFCALPDGPPTGTVPVDYMGNPICTVSLGGVTSTESSGTCTPTGGPIGFNAGGYPLSARYSGDVQYELSTDDGGFQVVPENATITLEPLASASYGDEQSIEFLADPVPALSEGDISGTVTVATIGGSATTLCSYAYPGTNNCAISAADLPAGSYNVEASFNPGSNVDFNSASSDPVNLTISRAGSTTGFTRSAAKVTFGREKSEHLRVSVQSLIAGTLSGSVTIRAHMAHHKAVTVCKITLSAGAGSCTLKAKALKAGKYTLTASFPGDVDFAPSAAPSKVLTVKK